MMLFEKAFHGGDSPQFWVNKSSIVFKSIGK